MGEPNPGRQLYLATCNHRPFDLSSPVHPRIPRALTLHHIHESSPCCCCAALPPADTYKAQRKSELSAPAPNTANINLLATRISGPHKYSTGLLHTSYQHRHFEKLSKNKMEFQQRSCSIWIPFPEWRRCSHEFSVGILTACFCNGYCPPCIASQVNFLFLFYKVGF